MRTIRCSVRVLAGSVLLAPLITALLVHPGSLWNEYSTGRTEAPATMPQRAAEVRR